MNEKLTVFLEPHNEADKYTVCVKKKHAVADHLPLGKNWNLAKMIFYFLRVDQYATSEVIIPDKPRNLYDGDGIQVPCNLIITGK